MKNTKIETKSGWIITNSDKKTAKEVQYFTLTLLPHINTLNQPSVSYYTLDNGKTWLKGNSILADTIYSCRSHANAIIQSYLKYKKEIAAKETPFKMN